MDSHVIYIIRHGETYQNDQGILQGQRTIATLSPNGITHAENIATWLEANSHIIALWSSPLQRALLTAEIIGRVNDISIQKQEELTEIDFGEIDGIHEIKARDTYKEFFARRDKDKQFKISTSFPGGGENYMDVYKRLKPIAAKLQTMQDDIAVVAHRVVNKLLIAHLCELPIEEMAEYIQQHNEIVKIELPSRKKQSYFV